jgi:hypothetical protein
MIADPTDSCAQYCVHSCVDVTKRLRRSGYMVDRIAEFALIPSTKASQGTGHGLLLGRNTAMQASRVKASPTTPLPEWYNTYFLAVIEADEEKALIRLERAERVLQHRQIQLQSSAPEDPQEPEDLDCALTYLRLLLENMNPAGRYFCASASERVAIAY